VNRRKGSCTGCRRRRFCPGAEIRKAFRTSIGMQLSALDDCFRQTQWIVGISVVAVGVVFVWTTHCVLVSLNNLFAASDGPRPSFRLWPQTAIGGSSPDSERFSQSARLNTTVFARDQFETVSPIRRSHCSRGCERSHVCTGAKLEGEGQGRSRSAACSLQQKNHLLRFVVQRSSLK